MTGLVMTKTKTQHGLVEPITQIKKPWSIQAEMGLPAQKDAWYRYTWDRSLFLTCRRKELQSIMAELNFSQQVGKASVPSLKPFRVGPVFSQITFAFSVSLRTLMAWRWWAKGGLSPVLWWKTIQCLKGAWKAPLRTQCT